MHIMKIGMFTLSILSTTMAIAKSPNVSTNNTTTEPLPPQLSNNSYSTPVGGEIALAFDNFRSLPEGSWSGNTGAFSSVNFSIGLQEHYGFGLQLGGSYGLYNWDGKGSNSNTSTIQQQGFVTGGLIRATPNSSGWNAGVVYDVMFNKQFGVFGLNPIIAQIRGQIGYLIKGENEVGFFGTYNTQTSHKQAQYMPVTFRAVSQANFFWTHYFKSKAQTTLFAGTPYRKGLMYDSGRAGSYIVGANFKAPISKTLNVFAHGVYMGARNGGLNQKPQNYAANVCFGISYGFGSDKAGQKPYLPVADNSNFIVDTNTHL